MMIDKDDTWCNIKTQTSIDIDDYTIEGMNQKQNYFKALQIAASLTHESLFKQGEGE